MSAKIDLHWFCDSPTPYNSQLFQFLSKNSNWNLLVHYRKLELGSHPWQSNLTDGYELRPIKLKVNIDWKLVGITLKFRKKLRKQWFIFGSWNYLTIWVMFIILGLRSANLVIWTDTPNQDLDRTSLKQKLRSIFLRWVLSRCKYVLATGKPGVDTVIAMGANPKTAINFPYWIDIDNYISVANVRSYPSLPTHPLVFISSGILLNERKGHDIVFRALAIVAARSKVPVEYWIAGKGPDELILKELATELGVSDQVKFLGWLEQSDILKSFGLAHVFIHPSPIHEPYGVAVIEAMATGLPVLVSDKTCAGIDRVIPNINGFIHSAGNINQLAEQMLKFVNTPNLAVTMGSAALATSCEWPIGRAVSLLSGVIDSNSVSS